MSQVRIRGDHFTEELWAVLPIAAENTYLKSTKFEVQACLLGKVLIKCQVTVTE